MVLTPSREAGEVYVDYMIEETRPWMVYSELSDTGTSDTGDDRLRLGFTHFQLTGHDDILRVDFVTSTESSDTVALFGSYDAIFPWWFEAARWRTFGGRCLKHPSFHRVFICLIIFSAISAPLR